MDKELFIESINALEAQYRWDKKFSDLLGEAFPYTHAPMYDNHYATNHLLKILQVQMNDSHKYSWIEYYCFEIDFGKNYKEGCAMYKNGDIIDIPTPAALYDFLIKNSL